MRDTFEEEWGSALTEWQRMEIALHVVFVLTCSCLVVRGEEVAMDGRLRGGRYGEVEQARRPDVIPASASVTEEYGLGRSGRRGSSTHAANMEIDRIAIELQARWKSLEAAKGRSPNLPMRQHYMEMLQSLRSHLRYSQGM